MHHSASQCGFSFRSHSAQATPFTSMLPLNSPFSAQTQTNQVTGFSSIPSNSTSPFPLLHSNMFSAQTQHSGVTPFSPFSSRSNANSHFPSVHSNPFSLQSQSNSVTAFAPFSSHSNTNSPFPSVSSNVFSGQTKSSGVTGFAPFSSQSNASSYLSNYSNPFTSQTPSFNSTLSTTISIPAPALLPSSGSRVAPYASTKEPEGNFSSISSMPVYTSKSHEELRFEDYSLRIKDGQGATTQTGNGIKLNNSFYPSVFPSVKPAPTNLLPAIVSPPINSQTTFPGFISPQNTQSIPSNPPGLFIPSTSATSATAQGNIFASSSSFDVPKSPNIVPSLPSFVSNSSLSQVTATESSLCSNCNRAKTQSFQPGLVGASSDLSPNQLKPSSIEQTVQELGKDDAVPVSSSHPGSVISVQYGISSLPVSDKAAPTRRRSLLIVRHSSLNRTKMLCPRYNLDSNASRVPFFMAGEEKATEGVAKTNSVIFPRQNPRSWIHPLTKESPQSHNPNTLPEMEHTSINVYGNGNVTQAHREKEKQTNTCEGVINYKHDHIDVDGIMPKLKNDDYYTEPSIQELAAREKEEPGFCHRVKDFVVGRRGFGAIKFIGETNVEGLELDALVQFNYHEVIVYMDDSKKPQVGEGLNKPAEVTLLGVKCINKKTGEEYKDGHLVDKYKNLLIRKSAEQGAEFVSYDPVKGEWKFKVKHF